MKLRLPIFASLAGAVWLAPCLALAINSATVPTSQLVTHVSAEQPLLLAFGGGGGSRPGSTRRDYRQDDWDPGKRGYGRGGPGMGRGRPGYGFGPGGPSYEPRSLSENRLTYCECP